MPLDTLAGTDTESAPDDLRGDIAALFDSDTSSEAPAPQEAPADGADAESASPADAASAPVADKTDHPTDPARYADGTYKRTKTEAAPEKAAPVDPKLPSTDATKASEPAASNPQDAPPAGWTAEAKAEWSKLSPALKAAVLKREVEIASGGRQWSEEKRRYEGVLSPVAQAASRRGISTEEGIQRLVAAQNRLDENPAQAIKWLAQSYGVDLATLAGQPPAEGVREQSPDIAALVRQAVQPMLAPLQERFYAEDNARQQSTVNLVTDFAASPGREHFPAVQEEIMAMIPQIKTMNPAWSPDKVLQEAYDRAVYANPTTRAAVLAANEAQAEAKRQTEAKARAAKARLAGSSVTGAPSGVAAVVPKDSLRAEIEAAFSG